LCSGPSSRPINCFKSTFINRMTGDEAVTVEAVRAGAGAELRMLFKSVEYFVSDDPLFADLQVAVAAALGEVRADELLGPAD